MSYARPVRRLLFAAPFVVVTAHGCRRPPPEEAFARATERWTIEREGDMCYANEHGGCGDPEATCNPPPPFPVRCVYGAEAEVLVQEVDGACWAGTPPEHVRCPPEVEITRPQPRSRPQVDHPPWLDDGPI
jgi:hypothetical protein